MSQIRVLVVDDSALMRKMITNMVESDEEIKVEATAANGIIAFDKLAQHDIDVILLDIEMPQMDGVEFLIRRRDQGMMTPVVVLSSLGRNRPELTLQCMDLGAGDFIIKPSGTISLDIEKVQDDVIAKIKYFAKQKAEAPASAAPAAAPERAAHHREEPSYDRVGQRIEDNIKAKLQRMTKLDVVAVGISTGGPNALRSILPRVPAGFPVPILIVQHMPAGFTREFAKGLDQICPLTVREAEDGDRLQPGTIYIAPGDKHMKVARHGGDSVILLDSGPQVNGHRPSVEVLFDSVGETMPGASVAVIMTGMGKDGAHAIKQLWQDGSITLAQDEDTCVVFGMPKVAIEEGGVDEVLPLPEIPQRLIELVQEAKS